MLKAGEYSPNNPLLRGERATGDVLLGLGEYERRRNTLRKIRQQQYKEYLDQQAKKKQEAKEEAERERREREQREREREERERRRLEEELEASPERRRASLNFVPSTPISYANRVDTGVQVEGGARPLSVAVQTDDTDFFRLTSPSKCELTEAERELSPRTVVECSRGPQLALKETDQWKDAQCARRRSYGDYDERTCSLVKRSNRDKLTSDLRHTYMPSIFDADAIQMRNMQAEKEAAERRQYYQQELKNQIMEQQRIKEERKTREKMLEQAEMRRLEEQLRMLKVAQEREITKQWDITAAIKDNAENYDNKRIQLQNDIQAESQKLRAKSQHTPIQRTTTTSRSDNANSKLPFYYPKDNSEYVPNPFSINIPDSSIFSSNYDVDSYLRRNLNFKDSNLGRSVSVDDFKIAKDGSRNVNVEKALVHNRPKDLVGKYGMSLNLKSNSTRNSPNNYIYSKKSDRHHIEEIIDKENTDVVKNTSPSVKENKRLFNYEGKINNYNDEIDIPDNNARKLPAFNKDIVGRRNYNFQILDDDIDKNDNLDVQVKNRNDKFPIVNDQISKDVDKYVMNDKNNKYVKARDIIDKSKVIGDKNDKRKETGDKNDKNAIDVLPIPVLRHSPKIKEVEEKNTNMSDAMKLVDDKWRVPAVQKNILKKINEEGKNVSILTQLGSIRRQLQLEQLKLDNMLTKD